MTIMSDLEKYEAIEALFEKSISPALAADGGSVDLDLVKGNEVIISFQGACGSCPSSAGGTLRGIERAIQQNVFPDAIVIPTNSYQEPKQQAHPFGGKTYAEQIAERNK